MTALQNEIQLMRKSLEKATESVNISTTEAEVWDILQALKKVPMTVELLRETLIGRTVHDVKKKYDSENKIYNETKIMIANWKKSCDVKPIVKADSIDKEEKFPERKSSRESKPIKFQVETSPPQSHGMIRTSEIVQPIPERNAAGELVFPDFPNFRPNLTPKEVLQMGSFGGTYFRPITSSVTKQSYKDVWEELPSDWLKGLNIKTQVASSNYSKSINKYKDTCGGDLEMWESSGWITAIDPYGWFMWYCRFYQGRRCSDDTRQVGRGNGVIGPTGRWRRNLANKVLASGLPHAQACEKYTISPKIRQLLQHWGYKLTVADLAAAAKKK